MILLSSTFMAVAWLGHLRYRHLGFGAALLASWCIVLPEYVLNVAATRWGYGTYTGAQMAGLHLVSGVLSVALVSRFMLGEAWSTRQFVGFFCLAVGMLLVANPSRGDESNVASTQHAVPAE
jgi:uncharacterized protein